MLYHLLYPLHQSISFFNIFRYITFRAAMATITAFLISVALGPVIIRFLTRLKIGENVRKEDSVKLYELHGRKQDTPTMGGLLILSAVLSASLLWADLSNRYIQLVFFSTVWLGITGFTDDYLKHIRKKSKGLTAASKFMSQIILGLVIGTILFLTPDNPTRVDVPFLKDVSLELGIFYIFFVILVVTGSSNAVNLTDGLDGLAIGTVIMAALAFSVLSYVSGNIRFSEYLFIPYLKGSGELTVFCSSILGAGLGFLWFNCYPASIFMGDVGSLALGGALGTVALLIKKELLLIIVGGIFVIEALSVILQVASFKLTGKRIFKIAPLHHHFQFLGWPESKVIVRFWIIAALLSLFTIVTLKIR
ncbi:MAG: phospho-N-acetylmuramoyl-pentapeptide-transferase [Candidatus Omnitrophica bacterium]|nr:phospho-N-acetylmuramoyl-pentapeptide-transferase [Candidatus Omnitrophota bacterium]MDD5552930.1 phospho-N-acetylmuramoyl-pentapeptide-transferase [Candidatus Omnitrophota bacterium]